MKTTRDFCPADRYVYDFGACSVSNGFAQVDTSQDASYFGTWASPDKLLIVNYCEGDVTVQKADNPEEFKEAILAIKQWNEEQGHRFIGIDPGLDNDLPAKFEAIGLGELLH